MCPESEGKASRMFTMLLGNALFQAESSGMVIVGDIEFYSMCEHHILPFFGKVSVGYMPPTFSCQ